MRRAVGAIEPSDPTWATIHASEALFWASILGDLATPDARHPLYRALQIPRNAVAHGAAVCVGLRDGLVWPVTWPVKWIDVVWAPLESLTMTLDRAPRASAALTYQRELAGQSVVPVLDNVLTWYSRT